LTRANPTAISPSLYVSSFDRLRAVSVKVILEAASVARIAMESVLTTARRRAKIEKIRICFIKLLYISNKYRRTYSINNRVYPNPKPQVQINSQNASNCPSIASLSPSGKTAIFFGK
jgi:hypothetical protein